MPFIRSTRSARPLDPAVEAVPAGMRTAGAFSWRFLVVLAALAVVVAFVVLLQDIVVPFCIGLLLCALLAPMSAFLQRHRWPKWLAVLSCFLAVAVVIAVLALVVTAQIRYDLPSLERRLHHTADSLQSLLNTEPFGITSSQVDKWISQGTDFIEKHASSILSGFQAAGLGVVHALEGLFIVVFTTLFVLIDGKRIWAWVVRLFPRRARARIDVAGNAGWKTLTSFIRVQLVVAVTDALGIVIGALALQLPLAIPIGVVVFLGAFVPVVGAIVGGTVAVVIALVFSGWVPALVMLGIVVVVQQLESHVLHPFLTGSAVKVHPLGVVLGVTAGTTIAGVVGAFFAVPFIATVNAMVTAAAAWKPDGTGPDGAGSVGAGSVGAGSDGTGPDGAVLPGGASSDSAAGAADHGGVQS
ncbi:MULTISPECIES: AI-2E family transporter [unclassified Curtobacterium]|uniref:AI-2E family transporter n=1 Tax=unclassified Curtobacterium TaxID=257496 RepID=UPI0008DD9A8C|nr:MULTISPECIES: AI-2E family transporter [unclassified Curtobacterium]WIA97727.1 AI-2E family transporter [Curtobacterium sp. MCBA15_004]WIB01001.1 AI-2E family transporter [Curtobacterium sp. MCBA15_012]